LHLIGVTVLRGVIQIACKHIRSNTLDESIVPAERGNPFAASSVEYFTAPAREVHDHAGTALYALDSSVAIISNQNLGSKLRVLIGEESIVNRDVEPFFFE